MKVEKSKGWKPVTPFQERLKEEFGTKIAIAEFLEISRPYLDKLLSEEHRFYQYLPVLCRKMKLSANQYHRLLSPETS